MDISPDVQILLIAEDVDEVKTMMKKLEGTVATIHVALVGDIANKDQPGILEELRALSKHTHPEIAELRTQMRIFNAKVAASLATVVAVIEFVARVVWK